MARVVGMITIDRNLCKGCSLCVKACPSGLMSLEEGINPKGYHPASAPRREECNGCALCAMMCPEACIEVRRQKMEDI